MLPAPEKFSFLRDHPCRHYAVGTNPSYRNSLRNGLVAGLWWVPASLMILLRLVLLPCLMAIAYALFSVSAFALYHCLWLGAALAGRLRDRRNTIQGRLE